MVRYVFLLGALAATLLLPSVASAQWGSCSSSRSRAVVRQSVVVAPAPVVQRVRVVEQVQVPVVQQQVVERVVVEQPVQRVEKSVQRSRSRSRLFQRSSYGGW